jgi:phosphoribosylamine-glycine ligase
MASLSVLIVGSGGREHAIAWKLAQVRPCAPKYLSCHAKAVYLQSPQLATCYVAPGNGGTNTNVPASGCRIVSVDVPTAGGPIIEFVRSHHIGLVVIGPERPLADGLSGTPLNNQAVPIQINRPQCR